MNELFLPPLGGVPQPRFNPHLLSAPKRRVRIAVFGSFYGGYHVLRELLRPPLADQVTVVGVATDDITQPFVHANVRLWKYPHTRAEELLVPNFASEHALPVYTGRVKTPEFDRMFVAEWNPDLCLMATFGQKIPLHLIQVPRLGFFNFHHSSPTWPSYPGPDPIRDMQRDGRTHLVLTLHRVSEVIDDGEFFARSHPVKIPPGVNAIEMHRITWPQMGGFISSAVEEILDAEATDRDDCGSMTMHEEPVPYIVGEKFSPRARARRSADRCMAGLPQRLGRSLLDTARRRWHNPH